MKQLPETKDTLVLRTDFSDATAWELVCAAIREPGGEFKACVDFLSESQYECIAPENIFPFVTGESNHTIIFVIDSISLSRPDHPVLVVDLYAQPGRTFRVIPSEMSSIENNLSISNMDFEEFAESVDRDGVFRGFAE